VQIAHQIAPFLTLRAKRGMARLEPGLLAVTRATQGLQIREIEGQFRRIADGLNVIHFKALPRATLHACEAVTPLGLKAQSGPAAVPIDPPAMRWET